MKRASISTLKAKLSQFLDAVKAGEEVLVTERGKPIARLSPVKGSTRENERIERLVRTGQLLPPRTSRPPDLEKLDRPDDPKGSSLESLLEERAEGR